MAVPGTASLVGPQRVLIADIDADVRARYGRAFAERGYDVAETADGHHTLLDALGRPPALIVAGLHLPVLDIFTICDVLRRNDATRQVRILIAVREATAADLARARETGAFVVLTSAFAIEDVMRAAVPLLDVTRRAPNPSPSYPHDADKRVVTPSQNRILAQLPHDDLQRLGAFLTTVKLEARQVLQKQHEPARYVYFPLRGVVSVTTVLSDARMVEVALVGSEGMIGIEAFFTDEPIAAGEAFVRVVDSHGLAERISVQDFRSVLSRRGILYAAVGRYTNAKLIEMIQTAGCNAVHSVRQRCACRLLLAHDRMQRSDFHLSHDFVAMMLGVSRPSVSEAAATLQTAGLIRYVHGHVHIVDRHGLEAAACECYETIRSAYKKFDKSARTVT